ncbi:MAG TPA: hemolysin family protein [Phycisphaerae bacterium]|nr:hemolysin family protein [Phycisphaerae bacterium]
MIVRLGLLVVLLGMSAFFSGSETTLFALKRHELYRFQHDPRSSRRLVATLMQQPRKLLLTLIIGSVTVNLFIFAISLSVFQELTGPRSPLAPVLGLVSPIMITLLGEILPKGIAIDLRNELAPRAAPLIRLFQVLLAPVTFLLNVLLVEPTTRLLTDNRPARAQVTAEELRELVEMSERRQIIDADENAMLSGVIQLNALKVRDVMVPRVDIIAFEVHDNPQVLRELMRERHLPKIPVYDEDIDHLVGLVYARDLFLRPDEPLEDLARPVPFVPEIITLTQVLRHFRTTGTALAIAVDEYGGVVGLLTIEDVAEKIVGELAEDGEEKDEATWERLDDRHYRVSGRLSVHDWAELFNIHPFDDRVTTLAGLVISHLGRLPAVGDEVTLGNLHLTVESLRGRRIEWLRLELLEPQHAPPERGDRSGPANSREGT